MTRDMPHVSLCLDDAGVHEPGGVRVNVHADPDSLLDKRASVFVQIGDGLSLWSHEPQRFEYLAAVFMEAAGKLKHARTECETAVRS